MQDIRQSEEFIAFCLHELGHRDACPAGYDLGYLLFGDLLLKEPLLFCAVGRRLLLLELSFEIRQDSVLELCALLVIRMPLGILYLESYVFDLLFEILHLKDAVLLILPLGSHASALVLEFGKFFLESLESCLRSLVFFLAESLLLYLELGYLSGYLVEFGRHAVDLSPDAGCRLIHEVYRLVRKEPVANVSVGQSRACYKSAVRDPYSVMDLEFLLETSQDRNGIFDCRLVNEHLLETSLKSRILLDILSVFVKRCSAYAVELAPCQLRLQKVAGVHRALSASRAYDIVDLIDKEDYPSFRFFDLIQHRLETLLEFAPVLCARDKRAHVKSINSFVL